MRILKIIGYAGGLLVALVYLANPGAGVIELIPDNLPVIGNLDEAAAIALLVTSFKGLRRLRSPAASARPAVEIKPKA